VVLTLTAPPGLAWIGWLLQRVRESRHVTWEMDVYPDIAVALGMPAFGWLGGLLDYPRRRADAVIALGDCMKALLIRHRIPEGRIRVVENWADGRKIHPMPFPERSPLRILYSGNLGLAHDVATIRGAMERLADDPRFYFDFAGGGPERKELDDFCRQRGIGNVSFRPYVRREQLGQSLAEGHIGLVTQKPATLGAVVPSKTYGLMAAGRPVLYIGPAAATPARVVRRFDCGWQFECGDVDGVVGLLERLVKHPEEMREKGERGHRAFVEHYDMPAGVARICRVLGLEDRSPDQVQPELTEGIHGS
jgi:glycosyltransferase involved in cell wall biosynthesis